jgi:hypothetical protein
MFTKTREKVTEPIRQAWGFALFALAVAFVSLLTAISAVRRAH